MRGNYKHVALGDISIISSGGTPSRTNPRYWNGNIPWVKTAQIQNCAINEQDVDEWITKEGLLESSAKMIPAGTILMAMYGQGKTRGRVSILNFDASINQACAAIELKKGVDRDYIYQFLLASYSRIRALSNTGGQENLSAGLIKEIPLTLPPLPEQKAIADLLSTWDVAIEQIERLIRAKEKRFKWLRISLIRDEKEWTEVKLGVICRVTKGEQLNVAHMKADGSYYALNGGIKPSGRTDDWNTEAGIITISEGGNSCGYVNFNTERFWSGGHCYSLLNVKKSVDMHYLFFYLKMNEPKLMNLRVGSGLPNIQKKDVDRIKVSFPPLSEQQQIAQALNAAQQEIDILNQMLKKYKIQKRGLMQKMLTEKWRVKQEIVNQYMEA